MSSSLVEYIKEEFKYQSLSSEIYDIVISTLKRPLEVAAIHQSALLITSYERFQSFAVSLLNPVDVFQKILSSDVSFTRLFAGGFTVILFRLVSRFVGAVLQYFFENLGLELRVSAFMADIMTAVITYPLLGASVVQALTGESLVNVIKGKYYHHFLSLWSGFLPHYIGSFFLAEYYSAQKKFIISGSFLQRLAVTIPGETFHVLASVWSKIEALTNGGRNYNLTLKEPWRLFAGLPLYLIDAVTDDLFGMAYDVISGESQTITEEISEEED
eukprot:TRINITY_DN12139_c0_g1_i1.p1 TRINITY_DN12139_c0_g1~~TRINITY_DN12139_c0_g1_i1.p1  ORF type:complete len:272 (+),score=65.15 TRINITY_DN12139_c0_g1_i1:15-830(+)